MRVCVCVTVYVCMLCALISMYMCICFVCVCVCVCAACVCVYWSVQVHLYVVCSVCVRKHTLFVWMFGADVVPGSYVSVCVIVCDRVWACVCKGEREQIFRFL